MKKNNISFYLNIAVRLLLICAIVAGMLAFVNKITKDKIAENQSAEINEKLSDIFGDGITTKIKEGTYSDGVVNFYEVYDKSGAFIGACVHTEEQGYGGIIGMLTGINSEGNIIGIRIIEISETAGLGSRVSNLEYLNQYEGKGGKLSFDDEGIDAITGSTVSSRTVLSGVNLALDTFNSSYGIVKEAPTVDENEQLEEEEGDDEE